MLTLNCNLNLKLFLSAGLLKKTDHFFLGMVAFMIYFTQNLGEVKLTITQGENHFSHLFLC